MECLFLFDVTISPTLLSIFFENVNQSWWNSRKLFSWRHCSNVISERCGRICPLRWGGRETFTVAKHATYPSCRNKKCRGHPEGSGDFHGNKANKAKDGASTWQKLKDHWCEVERLRRLYSRSTRHILGPLLGTRETSSANKCGGGCSTSKSATVF